MCGVREGTAGGEADLYRPTSYQQRLLSRPEAHSIGSTERGAAGVSFGPSSSPISGTGASVLPPKGDGVVGARDAGLD